MARFLIFSVITLLSVACATTGPATGGNPTPSPAGGLGFDVTATEADHAVSMHTGQKLEVVLRGGGQITYQQVKTSNPSVLEPAVDPAATAARGVTLAAFQARASGKAEVTAVGMPVCPSGRACPMYAVLYTLTVTVT